MYPAVKEVKAGNDYVLILTFANGAHKKFDMKPYLDFGVFKELREISKFNAVHVCFDSIAWENNADFDPEVLYNEGIEIVENAD